MEEIARAEQIFVQLLRLLVRYPEKVTSTTVSSALGQTFRVSVYKADLGVVIGKRGQTARSLRILLTAIGANLGSKLMLDISENPVVEPPEEPPV